jgi:hypothetical protein
MTAEEFVRELRTDVIAPPERHVIGKPITDRELSDWQRAHPGADWLFPSTV